MKPRLASAAADRLAAPVEGVAGTLDAPLGQADVLGVLARIARTGNPGDRLRAAELIGRHLGMFREEAQRGMTLEELVLAADRKLRGLPEVTIGGLSARVHLDTLAHRIRRAVTTEA